MQLIIGEILKDDSKLHKTPQCHNKVFKVKFLQQGAITSSRFHFLNSIYVLCFRFLTIFYQFFFFCLLVFQLLSWLSIYSQLAKATMSLFPYFMGRVLEGWNLFQINLILHRGNVNEFQLVCDKCSTNLIIILNESVKRASVKIHPLIHSSHICVCFATNLNNVEYYWHNNNICIICIMKITVYNEGNLLNA